METYFYWHYYHLVLLSLQKAFVLKQDTLRARRFAAITTPMGVVAGFLFAGIGAVPFDLHFELHVFFAHYAFLSLFFLAIFHSLSIHNSKFLSNHYLYGYIFILRSAFNLYLYYIFWTTYSS